MNYTTTIATENPVNYEDASNTRINEYRGIQSFIPFQVYSYNPPITIKTSLVATEIAYYANYPFSPKEWALYVAPNDPIYQVYNTLSVFTDTSPETPGLGITNTPMHSHVLPYKTEKSPAPNPNLASDFILPGSLIDAKLYYPPYPPTNASHPYYGFDPGSNGVTAGSTPAPITLKESLALIGNFPGVAGGISTQVTSPTKYEYFPPIINWNLTILPGAKLRTSLSTSYTGVTTSPPEVQIGFRLWFRILVLQKCSPFSRAPVQNSSELNWPAGVPELKSENYPIGAGFSLLPSTRWALDNNWSGWSILAGTDILQVNSQDPCSSITQATSLNGWNAILNPPHIYTDMYTWCNSTPLYPTGRSPKLSSQFPVNSLANKFGGSGLGIAVPEEGLEKEDTRVYILTDPTIENEPQNKFYYPIQLSKPGIGLALEIVRAEEYREGMTNLSTGTFVPDDPNNPLIGITENIIEHIQIRANLPVTSESLSDVNPTTI